MSRRVILVVMASLFIVAAAPTAQAGPGSAICKAATNAYETVTGRYAPWACLQ